MVRSYLGYYAGSHQNSAAKRPWARIVLPWVTRWEVLVSYPFCVSGHGFSTPGAFSFFIGVFVRSHTTCVRGRYRRKELRFCASIGKHDVIIHGDVDCQPGRGNRRTSCVSLFSCEWPRNVCINSHADQPRSRNCTSKYVRKHGTRRSRAVDAKVQISLRAHT